MRIADSTPFSGKARQGAEQIAAAGDAYETKHAAPKAPRLRVESDQRQGFVEARQRLVHDHALRPDGPQLLGRRQGQHHCLSAPLDVDIADDARSKSFSVAGFRAPQKTSMGLGWLRDSRHAPSPSLRVRNVPGRLRRIFGFIASSYAGWTRPQNYSPDRR